MDSLIYLVRHTEPVLPDGSWRFLGRSDPPLSPRGVAQARELSRRLSTVHFDSVHSSDLTRCLLTAQIITGSCDEAGSGAQVGKGPRSPTGPLIHSDERLREIDAGLWEGLTREEAAARFPQEHKARERDIIHCPFPGGESFAQLRDRVVPALREIAASGGERMLIVAHKGVNRVLLCELLGLPLERLFSLSQDYGAVNVVAVTPPA